MAYCWFWNGSILQRCSSGEHTDLNMLFNVTLIKHGKTPWYFEIPYCRLVKARHFLAWLACKWVNLGRIGCGSPGLEYDWSITNLIEPSPPQNKDWYYFQFFFQQRWIKPGCRKNTSYISQSMAHQAFWTVLKEHCSVNTRLPIMWQCLWQPGLVMNSPIHMIKPTSNIPSPPSYAKP